MSGLRFLILAVFAIFLPGTVFAGESFPSPEAFAEHLRQIIIAGDRKAFIDAHMESEKISLDDKNDLAFLRYVFDRDADGKSIPDLMRRPDLEITTYLVGTETSFTEGKCSPWHRYVIIYTTISNDILGRLFDKEDHKTLLGYWKERFVETTVFRCGNTYKFAGTAFFYETRYPWIGDYG